MPSLKNRFLFTVQLGAMLPALSFGSVSDPLVEPAGPLVDIHSIVRLTYEHNLQVAAERYNLEAAELQFQRFIRSQSQFIPLIVESKLDREVESELEQGQRKSEAEKSAEVTLGMEKEFFDGTKIEARSGMRGSANNDDGRNTNPFLAMDLRVPLFSSFTRLERITERTFEESEMFSAWLDFIGKVRESINESQESYFDLQEELGRRRLVEQALADYRQLEQHPLVAPRANDVAQIRDQLQAYQSNLVNQEGAIDAARISLLDNIGLDALPTKNIVAADLHAENHYGVHYLTRDAEQVSEEAIRNDVEIRVLEIARSNEELKKQLAVKGRWDIVGRVFGGYDFQASGADPARRSGYRTGVGFSVRRNDPKLLSLSLRQSEAEVRKLSSEINFRRRQLINEIRRNLLQAVSLRRVVRELTASRELRRGVFEQKRTAYLSGQENVDNLIRARGQLFETEEELLEELIEFHQLIVQLDESSGQYFVQLGDAVRRFENLSPGAR